MGHVIIKPRAVIRQSLTEPTNLQYLSERECERIADIFAREDDQWDKLEFAYLTSLLHKIDDQQSGD